MKISGKECKSFINKLVKLCSLINRYNVEPISLMQVYVDKDGIEPILLNRPNEVDYYKYLKEIFTDNPIYSRVIKYLKIEKIKKKKDPTQYSPLVIATNRNFPLMKLSEEDLYDNKYILPFKYTGESAFSNTYFLIGDLLKNFLEDKIVTAVDENMKFYDENDCIYDTTEFIIPNKVSEELKTKFVRNTSPEIIFPLKLREKYPEDFYINEEIKEILVNLNTSIINMSASDVVSFNKDVGILTEEDIELEKILKSLKLNGVYYLENKQKTIKMLTYDEFFKGKVQKLLFMKKDTFITLRDEEKIPMVYCGLLLSFKENLLYIFYKYFNYDGV